MKKLLSIILACAMVMSLFCVVPVSAAAPTAGVYKAPYWFEDFESGTSPFAAKTSSTLAYTSEIADTGDADRGMAAKMVVSGSVNDGANVQGESSIPVKVGDIITLSAWIKSEQALASKARLSFIFYPAETEGVVRSYHFWALDFDKDSTDWQYVTTTVVADWAGETGNISYRWGDTGGLNYSAADTEGVVNDRTYWVDDFELKIERPTTTEKAYDYEEVVSLATTDGSSWDNIQILQQGSTDTQSVATEEVVVTPADEEAGTEAVTETNTFLRHTHNVAAPIWFGIKLKEPMKAGHTYVLTFRNRVRGLPLSDGTLDPAGPSGGTSFDYVNYQSDIPYSATTWTGSSSSGSYASWTVHSAAYRKTGYGPYVDIRWNGANKAATDYADWHNVSITYASTKQTIEEDMSTKDYIRVGTWLYDGKGTNLGTFDFDDFKVIDLGPVTNGSFERTSECSAAGIHDGSNSAQWLKSNHRIGGWHVVNGHASTQSLKNANMSGHGSNGVLYYQLTAESQLYQYVPMYAYESYTIKGFVRGAQSTLADGSKQYTKGRARLVADFTGDTLAEEVYDVLSIGDNGIVYGDWVEYNSAYNANAPMVLNVDLSNIGLIKDTTEAEDGSEIITSRVPTAGIVPKSAKIYVEFDETWEGNVNAPNAGYHAVYMDAFTMTRNATAKPVATEATAAMNLEGKITADYSFTTVADAQDASIYKITGGGKTLVYYDRNAIVVPEDMWEVGDLALTVIPYANGYFGEEVTVDVEIPVRPAVITLTPEEGMVRLYSDTYIESAQLIFASYDANGKMVDWEVRGPIEIYPDMPDMYEPSDLTAGATTVAMLWTDFTETYKPLTAAVGW